MPEYAPCPKCSSARAEKIGFTLWGGLLGPSLVTHVKCGECGATYNLSRACLAGHPRWSWLLGRHCP